MPGSAAPSGSAHPGTQGAARPSSFRASDGRAGPLPGPSGCLRTPGARDPPDRAPNEFEAVWEFLAEHGYGLVVVDAVDEFAVLVRKYTDHPENIFKHSVARQGVNDYNCFLMTDQAAVEQAVNEGATPLTEIDLKEVIGNRLLTSRTELKAAIDSALPEVSIPKVSNYF